MTSTPWHAPPELLERFTSDPGGLDPGVAASVESHLVACAGCRTELSARADPAAIDASWDAVADRIDQPRASVLEWLLTRLGVDSGPARLTAATPALRTSGLMAVLAVTAAAVVAARHADADGPFLLLAPLVPLALVAVTFSAALDPVGEAGVATPMHGAGLVVRRSVSVLLVAFAVLLIGSLATPELGSVSFAWVLPGLALAVGSLALGTWVRIDVAAGSLAFIWSAGLLTLRYASGHASPYADTTPFSTAGQLVALVLAAAAVVVLIRRADQYSTVEVMT